MKSTAIFVLLATAFVSGAVGGSLYGNKEIAIEKVKKIYDEAEKQITKIREDITKEKEKKDESGENQAKEVLDRKTAESKEQLSKNVKEVTRTAIAKGKPNQAIECIANVYLDGKKLIDDTNENSKKIISNVLTNKAKKLDFLDLQADIILNGLLELKKQNLEKLQSMITGFESVVTDASKKVESAKKQLNEIQNRISKPLLYDEYLAVKNQIENKFKELSDGLYKRLLKCVA